MQLAGVDDPRPLHPAALDRLAQRQRRAVVAEVADGGEAGAQGLHAVHLRLERVHLRLLADERQQPRLAAAVRAQMDMAVDQAGKDGLVAKVDQRRARLGAASARR